VVRGELKVGERLHGGGAGGPAAPEDPPLDAAAVVGDPRGDRDGVVHELHGDGAQEQVRRLLLHGWRWRTATTTDRDAELPMQTTPRCAGQAKLVM